MTDLFAQPPPEATAGSSSDRLISYWLCIAVIAALALPWYVIEDGFWAGEWLVDGYPFDSSYAPLAFLIAQGHKLWLAPLLLFMALPLLALRRHRSEPIFATLLLVAGIGGLGWLLVQGFSIGIRGWQFGALETAFGSLADRQFGLGYGALLISAVFLVYISIGMAARGAVGGDIFVVSAIGFVIALVGIFIFFPIVQMLQGAVRAEDGAYSIAVFADKFFDRNIWGLGCLSARVSCGVAWNSLALGVVVGVSTTALGLVFALLATRSGFRFGRILRALTILPIITPPFVIGLAIILLFGLSGTVTQFVADLFGLTPTRWVYGMPGIVMAQMLAYTPIAFLVLIGVVEGVSPAMEEAAQTLRANRWTTFRTITWPLMRPGLANAFLLGFIESMADFGNPLVLGGNFNVLSTEIFFSIVGAQNDQARAAVLAIVLLIFTLGAFFAQRRWLGKKSYAGNTGKGDGGAHPQLPRRLKGPIYVIAAFWIFMTLVIYGMIIYGGFVELWGLNNTLTLRHYTDAFGVGWSAGAIVWSGSAWDSFWTTLQIAAIAAPLTAMLGLVTAYLLVRQKFAGKDAFEFGTMLSFAIPGTVIGVSYILAFNVPPIELTATGAILVICFIFRNMPVGVRAGVASMAQLDSSLDEASATLGANAWQTFSRIILPLLRPAILAAIVYSFVRAMTAISAVIFLVSAEYNMATSYIIGRVENNDYGLAIAYSTVLIFVMLAVVAALQLLILKGGKGRARQS